MAKQNKEMKGMKAALPKDLPVKAMKVMKKAAKEPAAKAMKVMKKKHGDELGNTTFKEPICEEGEPAAKAMKAMKKKHGDELGNTKEPLREEGGDESVGGRMINPVLYEGRYGGLWVKIGSIMQDVDEESDGGNSWLIDVVNGRRWWKVCMTTNSTAKPSDSGICHVK